jgi:tetratricopeptide (TPR) repeat protein
MLAKGAELSSSVGNRRDTGLAYTLLAMLATYNGDEAQAAVWHQQSLALMQEAVDPWGQAVVLGNHGVSAFNLQQLDQAVASLQAALALFQQIEDSWAIMYASTYLGLTLVQQGNYRQADQMLRNALGITRILGKRVGIPENLEGLAATAIAAGQIERAVRLAGAADALREIVGSTMSPGVQSIRANTLTAARKRLHEHKLAHAREAGRTMSLEQAIDYALHPIRTRSA